MLSKPEIERRLQKWSIEMGEYDIQYRPRISVKGQILANFIVEQLEDDSLAAPMEVKEEIMDPWTLFEFDATNNEAKYEALIAGLRIAEQMGIKNLQTHVDSRLVANQVNGSYIAKEGYDSIPVEAEVLTVVEEQGNTWMTPIYEYLMEETLHTKRKKARAVRLKSRRYAIINGVLYKKSFLEPWLQCVRPLQANYVLREIHEGSCSMHAGPRSGVSKAIRTGYYWPTMHKDARKMIRECQDCQVHCPVPRNPQKKLTPITSPWPFYK
ncbi:reverse transcriptase domain-containing protein [Tanacetum coccineum]